VIITIMLQLAEWYTKCIVYWELEFMYTNSFKSKQGAGSSLLCMEESHEKKKI
jgi:hypothetical protein